MARIDPLVLRRLRAQLLAGRPARDPVGVARRLLAVQAQDLRGAQLAVGSRTVGGTVADVDRALTEERSTVITWLNRGTLHLVAREDVGWLRALTAPPTRTANARRLAQEGVTPDAAEQAVARVVRVLADEGPRTRPQLVARLQQAGIRTEGQAYVHVMMLAALRGLVVRGPMAGAEQSWVLEEDWLGPTAPVDRDVALAELARRYLAGHGPAGDRDLARWAGLGLGDARRGLTAIAGELRERPDGLLELRRAPSAAPRPPGPRLLGPFDPLLLGWASRAPVVGTHEAALVTSNGIFRPFALVDGRAVAVWRLAGGAVALAPFAPLEPEIRAALDAEAERVQRFLTR